MILFSAFIAGLLGSIHCIGMCGGIVGLMSQSTAQAGRQGLLSSITPSLLSNAGRISSYMLAGALAGGLGAAATGIFKPAYVQNIGLMLSGGFMVALGLYLAGWWMGLSHLEKLGSGVWRRLQPAFSRLLNQRGVYKSILTGVIWGWLPCGLVYSMLVWAATVATPAGGASIMLAFGVGTLPTLLGMGALSKNIEKMRHNRIVRQVSGSIIIGFGLLTLLGLVRPFHISPPLNPLKIEQSHSGHDMENMRESDKEHEGHGNH